MFSMTNDAQQRLLSNKCSIRLTTPATKTSKRIDNKCRNRHWIRAERLIPCVFDFYLFHSTNSIVRPGIIQMHCIDRCASSIHSGGYNIIRYIDSKYNTINNRSILVNDNLLRGYSRRV